jgi:uncharacterized protein (TIGR00369 family)
MFDLPRVLHARRYDDGLTVLLHDAAKFRPAPGAGKSMPMSLRDELGAQLTGLEQLQKMVEGDLRPGMGHVLGIRLVEADPGRVVLEGRPSESLYNVIGSVHGGFAATLLDFACGYAVLSTLGPGQGFSTIELKVSYLRPLVANTGRVHAEGQLVKGGRRVAFSEATLRDDAGAVYATASSSLLVSDGLPSVAHGLPE